MTCRIALIALALAGCVVGDVADGDEEGALAAGGQITTSGAREPQRRAAALHDYVMAVKAGTKAYASADLRTLATDKGWVLPAANSTNFQSAALTSLRHVMPSALSLLNLSYAILDTIPGVTDCDRVAVLDDMRISLETLDQTKEYTRKYPNGNIRIRQAMSGHAAASLIKARAALKCTTTGSPTCSTCQAVADRIIDGAFQEGFGYSDFWLDAFVPAAIVLTKYAAFNPFYQDFGLGSAANLRKFLLWREAGQRLDGTWTSLNDSAGTSSFRYGHLVGGLIASIPSTAPADVVAQQPDILRAVRRMGCVGRQPTPGLFPDPYLAATYVFSASLLAKFTKLKCADATPVTHAVFPLGGHAFVKSPAAQTMISMFNEGTFYVTDEAAAKQSWVDIRAEAEAPFKDTVTTNDFFQTSYAAYPLAFFNWSGEPSTIDWRHHDGLRPLHDFSYFDGFLASSGFKTDCVGPGTCGAIAVKNAAHNRAEDTHVEIAAYGKTPVFGAGFADYYDEWSPVHELRSPVAFNLPMTDGAYGKSNVLSTTKIEQLDSKSGYTLFRMATGSYDRYVISVGDRWYLVFDRTRSATSKITQEHWHVRGSRTETTFTSTQGVAYSQFTWSYDERLNDDAGTAKPGSRDDSVKLHLFPGLPKVDSAIRKEWHVDSCDDVDYLPLVEGRNEADYCKHESWISEPVATRIVTGYPFVIWPQKVGAAGDSGVVPTIEWQVGTRNGNVETYTVTAKYVRTNGTNATITFVLPAKPSTPITSLASLGVP
jgi:hypothetical protein